MCRADRPHCCRPIGRTFFFFFLVFHVNPLFFSNLFPLITLLAACGNEGPPRGSLYRPPFFLFRTTTTIIFGRVDSPALASLLQQATLLPIFFFYYSSKGCLLFSKEHYSSVPVDLHYWSWIQRFPPFSFLMKYHFRSNDFFRGREKLIGILHVIEYSSFLPLQMRQFDLLLWVILALLDFSWKTFFWRSTSRMFVIVLVCLPHCSRDLHTLPLTF